MAGAKGEGEREGEKLSPTPFDACYAGYRFVGNLDHVYGIRGIEVITEFAI